MFSKKEEFNVNRKEERNCREDRYNSKEDFRDRFSREDRSETSELTKLQLMLQLNLQPLQPR